MKTRTFSCRRCLSSFNSRYVLFDNTGVLKGFMIFFTATAWLVSWSLAELWYASVVQCGHVHAARLLTRRDRKRPCRRAASRCTCLLHQRVIARHTRAARSHLLVISKVVPKIWARTNSAMVTVQSLDGRVMGLKMKMCKTESTLMCCLPAWGGHPKSKNRNAPRGELGGSAKWLCLVEAAAVVATATNKRRGRY